MKWLFVLFFLASTWFSNAQEAGNFDQVYVDYIKSVSFKNSLVSNISFPLLQLNGNNTIDLSFDDTRGTGVNYIYKIVHCNMDWQPSQLNYMEYLTGYEEEYIRDYFFSRNTFQQFAHYTLRFPNSFTTLTKSGNYLLMVYEEAANRKLVLTRRFTVVEPTLRITPNFPLASKAGQMYTHQEIDFTIDHKDYPIRQPLQEVRAVMLQNGRWDNHPGLVPPKFLQTNTMIFDYQGKFAFPGGKEFRFLDMRSFENRSQSVIGVKREKDIYEITLQTDYPRNQQAYIFYPDLDGQFAITSKNTQFDPSLTNDYAWVNFHLEMDYLDDKEVYVTGGFADWQLKPGLKLHYDNSKRGYVGRYYLKQGYYDYAYATLPKSNRGVGLPNLSELEGDSFETGNHYTLIIYQRSFGARYDQAIAALVFQLPNQELLYKIMR